MSTYQTALANLNDEQRLAVTAIDGPVLVIAGPGTGKTQLLTTRIAHILATTDTLPQNILCLTFTESGARAMRDRLHGMIGQAAYGITISTYHAFGSELMRRFPDYFAVHSGERPIDDLGMDVIFRDIIAKLPYNSPLKYADNYLADVKGLVSDAKRALLSPPDLLRIAQDNEAFLKAAQPALDETLGGLARIDKKAIGKFEQLLAALQPLAKTTARNQTGGRIVPLAQVCVRELANALQAAHDDGGKTTPLTAWKNNWLAKDVRGGFVFDGKQVCEKLRVLADIYADYLKTLAERQLFDYDDMIMRVVQALQDNADFRYTLQEQYLYMLLDEFQDTNGAQLRLVELLTDNPANESRPNVLAVGDDDQAIYAFQGADYSHMLRFQQSYRGVLVVPLTKNYRSHAGVLALAEQVSGQIGERLHQHFAGISKSLVAANASLAPQATIERREALSDAGQFAWTAQHISQLIAEGLEPHEIAVLAPQHKYLEPLVPFLQQVGVPVRYEKRENVLDDPAIVQLTRMAELCLLLAAGDRQRANALWPEVLSFAFWHIPTSTIWQLSWQANDQKKQWTEMLLAHETLRPVALFFVRLSLLAANETLETMLDYLVGVAPLTLEEPDMPSYQSPFYTHYFGELALQKTPAGEASPGGVNFWHLLSNLTVLRSHLREYRADYERPLGLGDLLTFIQAHRLANIKILNTSPYQESTDAVQLMTAFKSKGLEFSAVFLLAVNDESWGGKARTQINHLRLPPNLQFIRYAGATNDERLRLLYVAITRAKTQLYLVNYADTFAGKALTRLTYLNETSGAAGDGTSPLLPADSQVILPADGPEELAGAADTELQAYWQQRHTGSFSHAELRSLLANRLKTFQLSPTHVNAFTDLEHAGPMHVYTNTLLRFPTAPSPQGQYGNAIHETLEWIHLYNKREEQLPDRAAVHAQFARCLATKQLTKQEYTQLLERGEHCLDAYLAQRAATVDRDNECEYNFRNEGVFIGKAHMTGKIDKLIIDRAAKTITIVDYKTGRNHIRWQHEGRLHRYRQQLYLYRALVEGSHRFAGYRVTDAYLEYVEPDENGLVCELHLDFDEQEYARAKQLAQAVWQRLQTLDMPDVSRYPANIRGIEAFESDLLAS